MNPYAPPAFDGPPPPPPPMQMPGGLTEQEARGKLMFPGITLIVMSSLLVLVFLFDLVIVSTGGLDMGDFGGSLGNTGAFGPSFMIGVCIFAALMNLVVLFSSIQMLRLRTWGLALAGSIIGALPFVSSACCVLTLPFSIWAIVVLVKPEVKAHFR